jgi:hypothetical protein
VIRGEMRDVYVHLITSVYTMPSELHLPIPRISLPLRHILPNKNMCSILAARSRSGAIQTGWISPRIDHHQEPGQGPKEREVGNRLIVWDIAWIIARISISRLMVFEEIIR